MTRSKSNTKWSKWHQHAVMLDGWEVCLHPPSLPLGTLKYVGAIQFLFITGHLCLIGVWLGEGQTNNHRKDTCSKEIGLSLYPTTQNLKRPTTYSINKHALPIHITESREVRFSIWFWLMFHHHRFANATTQSWGRKHDQQNTRKHEKPLTARITLRHVMDPKHLGPTPLCRPTLCTL